MSSWHVLQHAIYRRYFWGSTVSYCGTWVQNIAQMLLAYRLTGSVVAVGAVSVAQWAGVLVLSPWAGALADRFDRRQLLIATQTAAALVAATLAYSYSQGNLTLPYLLTGALALGLIHTFALPVFSAYVPTLVDEQDTKAALVMNTVSYNVGRVAAPILGIGVVSGIGFTAAFTVNALSFAVLAVCLQTIRTSAVQKAEQRPRIMDGFKIAWANKRILLVLLMVATATWSTDPADVLGPAIAAQQLGAPDVWAGLFLAAMGAGNVLGALLPPLEARLQHAAWSLGVVGVGMLMFGAGASKWLSLAGALVAGIGCLFTGAAAQSLIVKYAEPDQLGRVMAVWAVAWAGSRPIASVVDSWLAVTPLGLRGAALLMALPALLGAALALPPIVRRAQPILGPPAVFRNGRISHIIGNKLAEGTAT